MNKIIKTEIINILTDKLNKTVTIDEINKGNDTRLGVIIKDTTSNVAPIIYIDDVKNQPINNIVDFVSREYERCINDNEDISQFTAALSNREEFLESVIIAVAPKETYDADRFIVKTINNEIDAHIIMMNDIMNQDYTRTGKVIVTKALLNTLCIDEDTVWEKAAKNTVNKAQLKLLPAIVNEPKEIANWTILDTNRLISGNIEDEDYRESVRKMISARILVLGNEKNLYGAGIIFCEDYIKKIIEALNWKGAWICPSSIHEIILLPYKNDSEYNTLEELVTDINKTTVDASEFLSNKPLKFII